jgi:hypothetical protein
MNGQQMPLLPPPPPPPPDMATTTPMIMINEVDRQQITIKLKELEDENQLLRQQLNEHNKINSNKGLISKNLNSLFPNDLKNIFDLYFILK